MSHHQKLLKSQKRASKKTGFDSKLRLQLDEALRRSALQSKKWARSRPEDVWAGTFARLTAAMQTALETRSDLTRLETEARKLFAKSTKDAGAAWYFQMDTSDPYPDRSVAAEALDRLAKFLLLSSHERQAAFEYLADVARNQFPELSLRPLPPGTKVPDLASHESESFVRHALRRMKAPESFVRSLYNFRDQRAKRRDAPIED